MKKAVDIKRVIDDERSNLSFVILRHAELGMSFYIMGI
jgi:hypothetical protein